MDSMRVYIKDTLVKRKGVFAKVTMPTGTAIILERPAIVTMRLAGTHEFPGLEEEYRALSPLEKFEWAQLWRPEKAVKHIEHPWRFNCFVIDYKTRTHALYIDSSRLNHSCLPNARAAILPDRRILIETSNKVFQGSEITINYDSPNLKRLKLSNDFLCLCEDCGGPQEVFNYPRDEDGNEIKKSVYEMAREDFPDAEA